MTRNLNMAVVLVVGASLILSGCVKSRARLGVKIPASATSVEFLHPSSSEVGVNFVIQTQPFSLKYVDNIRLQIIELGYVLCKKSALSKWQYLRTSVVSNSDPKYWIVEMYTKYNYHSFMLLRVDESANRVGKVTNQKFTIVSHEIESGERNLRNIGEFCELKTNLPPASRAGS